MVVRGTTRQTDRQIDRQTDRQTDRQGRSGYKVVKIPGRGTLSRTFYSFRPLLQPPFLAPLFVRLCGYCYFSSFLFGVLSRNVSDCIYFLFIVYVFLSCFPPILWLDVKITFNLLLELSATILVAFVLFYL